MCLAWSLMHAYLHGGRSLVANLSAANNYKVDHLKKPEVWEIGKPSDRSIRNLKLRARTTLKSYANVILYVNNSPQLF